MSAMVPTSRPRMTEDAVRRVLAEAGVNMTVDRVAVYAKRGYYARTMGPTAGNDRGIYDDAIFVVGPNAFAAFNANTDPSAFRKGISSLKPGVHRYKKGIHGLSRPVGPRRYPAFRPATKDGGLPVTRDGQGSSVGYWLNIHKGSRTSTSSEGCQTIHPDQWPAFYALLAGELDRTGQKTFPYLLEA